MPVIHLCRVFFYSDKSLGMYTAIKSYLIIKTKKRFSIFHNCKKKVQ